MSALVEDAVIACCVLAAAYLATSWWLRRKARIRREYIASVTRQAAAAVARSLGERDA